MKENKMWKYELFFGNINKVGNCVLWNRIPVLRKKDDRAIYDQIYF